MTAPRLWVLTATETSRAVVLRRGPTRQVASLAWDRTNDSFEMGQWGKARVYEHRSDLSPNGRHMVYFAHKGATVGGYTVVSRAPWLRAVHYDPQGDTWFGGGAFTEEGALFLNGRKAPSDLPDDLEPAPDGAFPHSTDGFHNDDLFAATMTRRGWRRDGIPAYGAGLWRDLEDDQRIEATVATGRKNRSLVSLAYALVAPGQARVEYSDWTWAERWKDGLHFASQGALWFARVGPDCQLRDKRLIRDFTDMRYERIVAPYAGLAR